MKHAGLEVSHDSFDAVHTARKERLHHCKQPSVYPSGSLYVSMTELHAFASISAADQAASMDSEVPPLQDISASRSHERSRLRVHGIAAELQMDQRIIDKNELTDDELPLSFGSPKRSEVLTRSGRPLSTADWSSKVAEAFMRVQWQFLAPVFDRIGQHLQLHEHTILLIPWQVGDKLQTRKGWIAATAFDSSHLRFLDHVLLPSANTETYDHCKTTPKTTVSMVKCPSDSADFSRERKTLVACSRFGHDHITPLLFSFYWRSQSYLVFPLTSCNLREFWSRDPKAQKMNTSPAPGWVINQVKGLSSAIDLIQNELRIDGGPAFGLHGDISATNVLIFQDQNGNMTLKLADFACSALAASEDELRLNSVRGIIGTWQPPERFLDQEISRKFDVWSFECLVLEFLVWLLRGPISMKAFNDARVQVDCGDGFEFTNDFFFELSSSTRLSDPDDREIVNVNPAVAQTLAELRNETDSLSLRCLIDILEGGLLRVDPNSRMSSRQCTQALRRITSEY